ncbi:MAG: hypothetical protein ABR530_00225 [Pyrinomonadaceae bacterium]
MTLRFYSLVYAVVFCCLLALSVRADRVDDFVLSQLAERHIPGAAAAIIKDGRVVKMKGYGLASLEFNEADSRRR